MSDRSRSGLALTVRAAAGAGALGAALVGLAEGAAIWASGSLPAGVGLGTLLFGAGMYGAFGLAAGLGVGLLAGLLGRLRPLGWMAGSGWAAALAGAATLGGGALVIGTFRLTRDGGWSGSTALAAAAAGGLLLGLTAGWLFHRSQSRRQGYLAEAMLVVSLVGIFAGRALVGGALPTPTDVEGSASAERPNVMLIVVDTLRADITGPYGGESDEGESLTPNLDRFAAESIRFERMYANATWTRPAVASILTGLLPSGHRVIRKVDPLRPGLPHLAESIRQAGWSTSATVTNVNLAPDFGFGLGFDAYRYHGPSRPLGATGPAVRLSLVNVARLLQERVSRKLVTDRFYADGPRVTADALSLLDAVGDGPFFMWVHYMDPHDPFMRRPWDGTGVARVRDPHPEPGRAEEMWSLYEDEVRYWDAAFGDLLEDLERRGLLENTLVVMTSDHGEEFQEHGGYWHGQTLFEELARVPLLVRLPGAERGGEVDRRLAAQIDIPTTILHRAGVTPPETMRGRDLLKPAVDEDAGRAVIMEEDHDGNVLSGIVWDRFKYVRANDDNPRGQPPEALYDLEDDPRERKNLADDAPERRSELAALLDRHLEGESPLVLPEAAEGVEVDEALEEDLRSLGYVQ